MRRAIHSRPRGAFTLVELLVVITILGILFALTAAAVVRAIVKGDEVKTRNEVTQLTNAVKAFQQDFAVSFVPDHIILREDGNYGTHPTPAKRQIELNTQQYLSQLWPRLGQTSSTLYHDWNGNGTKDNGPLELEGHQCLVFFLGGILEAGIPAGFATDPVRPTKQPVANAGRKGPYYEFSQDRLKLYVAGSTFPSLIDVYGKAPYLYFSSNSSGNDYSTTTAITYQTDTGATETFNVTPYLLRDASAGVTRKFANPTGFQIISAGRDGRFGEGGVKWGGGSGSAGRDGQDDIANFHPTQLGITSN